MTASIPSIPAFANTPPVPHIPYIPAPTSTATQAETDEQKVTRCLDDLVLMLAERHHYQWELVGDAIGGTIVNINNEDGEYLYTLTISRTAGY